jgi:hypothetical protein
VQGDDLVADHVVAGLEVLGDGRARRVVVGDQGVGDPGAGAGRDDGGLADLGELEAASGGGSAFAYEESQSVLHRCGGGARLTKEGHQDLPLHGAM